MNELSVGGYVVNVEDRGKRGTERTVLFWTGTISDRGDDRYVSTFVYVFDPIKKDGETLPSIIIRPSGDIYTLESARRAMATLRAAVEWIEQNVGEVKSR
jgi:hypothetical protein